MSRGDRPGRVLYVGQAFYQHLYLSRALRELGWKADVLNWDPDPAMAGLYHGEDFTLRYRGPVRDLLSHGTFYLRALAGYDVLHFANQGGLRFGNALHDFVAHRFNEGDEIRLAKRLGRKVVYTNNGCHDGVAQSTYLGWPGEQACLDCKWFHEPSVCADPKNLAWGALRNELADVQCLTGGNHGDFNDDPSVHEVPEAYCLDEELWRPDLEIPARHRVDAPPGTVRIYHGVGDLHRRSAGAQLRNIKSTHVYLPLIERLKAEGLPVELIFAHDLPNKEVRFLQAQADIVCDMLTFGSFGANVREAMMLGKPVVCYLRPAFLEQVRRELPEYVDELPVVSATPDTVHDVLAALVRDPQRRAELGRRGRAFAVKWHGAKAAARRMDRLYRELIAS